MIEHNNFAIFLQVLKQILNTVQNSLVRYKVIGIAGNDVIVKLWAFVDEVSAHEVIEYLVLWCVLNQKLSKCYHLR